MSLLVYKSTPFNELTFWMGTYCFVKTYGSSWVYHNEYEILKRKKKD